MKQYLDLEKIAEDAFYDELVKIAGPAGAEAVRKYTESTIQALRKRTKGMTGPTPFHPEVKKTIEKYQDLYARS